MTKDELIAKLKARVEMLERAAGQSRVSVNSYQMCPGDPVDFYSATSNAGTWRVARGTEFLSGELPAA